MEYHRPNKQFKKWLRSLSPERRRYKLNQMYVTLMKSGKQRKLKKEECVSQLTTECRVLLCNNLTFTRHMTKAENYKKAKKKEEGQSSSRDNAKHNEIEYNPITSEKDFKGLNSESNNICNEDDHHGENQFVILDSLKSSPSIGMVGLSPQDSNSKKGSHSINHLAEGTISKIFDNYAELTLNNNEPQPPNSLLVWAKKQRIYDNNSIHEKNINIEENTIETINVKECESTSSDFKSNIDNHKLNTSRNLSLGEMELINEWWNKYSLRDSPQNNSRQYDPRINSYYSDNMEELGDCDCYECQCALLKSLEKLYKHTVNEANRLKKAGEYDCSPSRAIPTFLAENKILTSTLEPLTNQTLTPNSDTSLMSLKRPPEVSVPCFSQSPSTTPLLHSSSILSTSLLPPPVHLVPPSSQKSPSDSLGNDKPHDVILDPNKTLLTMNSNEYKLIRLSDIDTKYSRSERCTSIDIQQGNSVRKSVEKCKKQYKSESDSVTVTNSTQCNDNKVKKHIPMSEYTEQACRQETADKPNSELKSKFSQLVNNSSFLINAAVNKSDVHESCTDNCCTSDNTNLLHNKDKTTPKNHLGNSNLHLIEKSSCITNIQLTSEDSGIDKSDETYTSRDLSTKASKVTVYNSLGSTFFEKRKGFPTKEEFSETCLKEEIINNHEVKNTQTFINITAYPTNVPNPNELKSVDNQNKKSFEDCYTIKNEHCSNLSKPKKENNQSDKKQLNNNHSHLYEDLNLSSSSDNDIHDENYEKPSSNHKAEEPHIKPQDVLKDVSKLISSKKCRPTEYLNKLSSEESVVHTSKRNGNTFEKTVLHTTNGAVISTQSNILPEKKMGVSHISKRILLNSIKLEENRDQFDSTVKKMGMKQKTCLDNVRCLKGDSTVKEVLAPSNDLTTNRNCKAIIKDTIKFVQSKNNMVSEQVVAYKPSSVRRRLTSEMDKVYSVKNLSNPDPTVNNNTVKLSLVQPELKCGTNVLKNSLSSTRETNQVYDSMLTSMPGAQINKSIQEDKTNRNFCKLQISTNLLKINYELNCALSYDKREHKIMEQEIYKIKVNNTLTLRNENSLQVVQETRKPQRKPKEKHTLNNQKSTDPINKSDRSNQDEYLCSELEAELNNETSQALDSILTNMQGTQIKNIIQLEDKTDRNSSKLQISTNMKRNDESNHNLKEHKREHNKKQEVKEKELEVKCKQNKNTRIPKNKTMKETIKEKKRPKKKCKLIDSTSTINKSKSNIHNEYIKSELITYVKCSVSVNSNISKNIINPSKPSIVRELNAKNKHNPPLSMPLLLTKKDCSSQNALENISSDWSETITTEEIEKNNNLKQNTDEQFNGVKRLVEKESINHELMKKISLTHGLPKSNDNTDKNTKLKFAEEHNKSDRIDLKEDTYNDAGTKEAKRKCSFKYKKENKKFKKIKDDLTLLTVKNETSAPDESNNKQLHNSDTKSQRIISKHDLEQDINGPKNKKQKKLLNTHNSTSINPVGECQNNVVALDTNHKSRMTNHHSIINQCKPSDTNISWPEEYNVNKTIQEQDPQQCRTNDHNTKINQQELSKENVDSNCDKLLEHDSTYPLNVAKSTKVLTNSILLNESKYTATKCLGPRSQSEPIFSLNCKIPLSKVSLTTLFSCDIKNSKDFFVVRRHPSDEKSATLPLSRSAQQYSILCEVTERETKSNFVTANQTSMNHCQTPTSSLKSDNVMKSISLESVNSINSYENKASTKYSLQGNRTNIQATQLPAGKGDFTNNRDYSAETNNTSSMRDGIIRVKSPHLLTSELPKNSEKDKSGLQNERKTWYMAPDSPPYHQSNILLKDLNGITKNTETNTNKETSSIDPTLCHSNIIELFETDSKVVLEFLLLLKSVINKGNTEFEQMSDIIDCIQFDFTLKEDVINSVKKLSSECLIESEMKRAKRDFENKVLVREKDFSESFGNFMNYVKDRNIAYPLFLGIYYILSEKVKQVTSNNIENLQLISTLLNKWICNDVTKEWLEGNPQQLFDHNLKIVKSLFKVDGKNVTFFSNSAIKVITILEGVISSVKLYDEKQECCNGVSESGTSIHSMSSSTPNITFSGEQKKSLSPDRQSSIPSYKGKVVSQLIEDHVKVPNLIAAVEESQLLCEKTRTEQMNVEPQIVTGLRKGALINLTTHDSASVCQSRKHMPIIESNSLSIDYSEQASVPVSTQNTYYTDSKTVIQDDNSYDNLDNYIESELRSRIQANNVGKTNELNFISSAATVGNAKGNQRVGLNQTTFQNAPLNTICDPTLNNPLKSGKNLTFRTLLDTPTSKQHDYTKFNNQQMAPQPVLSAANKFVNIIPTVSKTQAVQINSLTNPFHQPDTSAFMQKQGIRSSPQIHPLPHNQPMMYSQASNCPQPVINKKPQPRVFRSLSVNSSKVATNLTPTQQQFNHGRPSVDLGMYRRNHSVPPAQEWSQATSPETHNMQNLYMQASNYPTTKVLRHALNQNNVPANMCTNQQSQVLTQNIPNVMYHPQRNNQYADLPPSNCLNVCNFKHQLVSYHQRSDGYTDEIRHRNTREYIHNLSTQDLGNEYRVQKTQSQMDSLNYPSTLENRSGVVSSTSQNIQLQHTSNYYPQSNNRIENSCEEPTIEFDGLEEINEITPYEYETIQSIIYNEETATQTGNIHSGSYQHGGQNSISFQEINNQVLLGSGEPQATFAIKKTVQKDVALNNFTATPNQYTAELNSAYEPIIEKLKNTLLRLLYKSPFPNITVRDVSLTSDQLIEFLTMFLNQIKNTGLVYGLETTFTGPLKSTDGRKFTERELKSLSSGVLRLELNSVLSGNHIKYSMNGNKSTTHLVTDVPKKRLENNLLKDVISKGLEYSMQAFRQLQQRTILGDEDAKRKLKEVLHEKCQWPRSFEQSQTRTDKLADW